MAVTNRRGIFSLLDVRERQGAGVWSTKVDVWLSPSPIAEAFPFGYFIGGHNPTYTTIERIDYSNDTAAAATKGPLNFAINAGAATGNTSFGYYSSGNRQGAGAPYGPFSIVQRIDYTNDTATAVTVGPLSRNIYGGSGATGTTNFGYFGGGFSASPTTYYSTVDRIDYGNDTATASPKGPLSSARSYSSATGNQSFGYFGGGHYPGFSTVDRIDYGNDTATAVVKGPLSVARQGTASTGNADFGYFGGGMGSTVPGTNISSMVDRVDYSNDTATTVVKGPLSGVRHKAGATGNTSFGYFGGGDSPSNPNYTHIDRIDYSNDTATAVTKGTLFDGRNNLGAVSPQENGLPQTTLIPPSLEVPVSMGAFSVTTPAPVTPVGTDFGYFGGGWSSMTTVDRVDYANDTATASSKGPLSDGRGTLGATGNASFGYFGGGFGPKSTVDRVDYSNDTATASPKGPLSESRRDVTATGNASFGYFGGGETPTGATSRVDRIDYSSDTGTASVKGPLSVANRYRTGATGNENFGYFGGGFGPAGPGTIVERIDYSNDTATAAAKGPLSASRQYLAATGNQNFGYFGGGNGPAYSPSDLSTVDRIDYSSDTGTASVKGPLSVARYYIAATGNQNFGYFGGGGPGAPFSIIDRIDYSNDTATAAAKGPLSGNRRSMAGSSSRANALPTSTGGPSTVNYAAGTLATPNTGYFVAGSPGGGERSVLDRIDYSNDTADTIAKGPLSLARRGLAATSNGSFGYAGGGQIPGNTSVSTVDRTDYLNDSSTALVKGPLAAAGRLLAATGNENFGYFGGGSGPSSDLSSSQRIDYSNDSTTASPKGPLNAARRYLAATGNQDFGYIIGGGPPVSSRVERIDYTNDTATASSRGNLSNAQRSASATGNANFGYVVGGYDSDGPTYTQSKIDRIDYSNDTATPVEKGSLAIPRAYTASTGDANFGYVGGGWPTIVSTVSRIDYSNDTAVVSPKGPLSSVRYNLAATSARANGFVPIGPAVVSNTPVQINAANYRGYIFGGAGDPSLSPAYNQPTQRIDFTNDTATALVKGSPAGGLYYNFAVGNTNYAYAANLGDSSPASVQRFDYSNETAALVFKGAFNTVLIGAGGPTSSVGGYNAAATGNHDYGWTNGGYKLYSVPAPSGYYVSFSQIDRIDYSNDTANALRRSYTTNRFGTGSATGTNDYGYWIGGSTSMTSSSGTSTKVDRTDYASDTTNAVAKGNLSAVQGDESDSIGNSSYGWVAGGRPWSSTTVDRIDYSNDTATASVRGPLAAATYRQSTTGSQSYGYFCGGYPGPVSRVQRVDYSNDTVTASPKGPLAYKNVNSSGASTTYNALSST